MQRRDLLKMSAFMTASFAGSEVLRSSQGVEAPWETVEGDMIYRMLGRTGQKVSLIGVGGSHIGNVKEDGKAIRIIRTAIDHGVTFMDNSWDYYDGVSETRMGNALRDGYRKRVFLAHHPQWLG